MTEFKSTKELQDFYKKFENQSLEKIYEFIQENYPKIKLRNNKGMAGQILEAVIGSAPNSSPQPDVDNLNIELKVLPLRKISNVVQPKERSKIKSINYNEIVKEEWFNSTVRNKIKKILFLLYEHPTGKSYKEWKSFVFRGTLLYVLEDENESFVKEDWEGIQYKVKQGLANRLSEGDGKILGACTSGTGKLQDYGEGKKAKQRSYSLKHSYLKTYYGKNKSKYDYVSLNLLQSASPENYILEELNNNLQGNKLKDVVKKYDVDYSPKAKSAFRLLINRILKIGDQKKILEIEEKGISFKTIPVNTENQAWESMSFPKFSLVDLIEEEWEGDSDASREWEEENEAVFKNLIKPGFIFIPIIKEKENVIIDGKKEIKFKNWKTWTIGKSIFWQPNQNELDIIQKEWEAAKEIVLDDKLKVKNVKFGKRTRQENNLIKSKDTQIIHMRPHARNSKDIDLPYYEYSDKKIKISWQSFWLNKNYTSKILNGNRIKT